MMIVVAGVGIEAPAGFDAEATTQRLFTARLPRAE
jgi:hypothetical protein